MPMTVFSMRYCKKIKLASIGALFALSNFLALAYGANITNVADNSAPVSATNSKNNPPNALSTAVPSSVKRADISKITIKNAELVPFEDDYLLNADLDVAFNEEIEQAIFKGFELNFIVEFQLVTPHQYWFDDEIATVTHHIVLSYHALSRQYLVTSDGLQKSFESFEEAEDAIASIRDLKVFRKSDVEKGLTYNAALLMRLDQKKLPKSLQVEAISSDGWQLSSQRFQWTPNLFK